MGRASDCPPPLRTAPTTCALWRYVVGGRMDRRSGQARFDPNWKRMWFVVFREVIAPSKVRAQIRFKMQYPQFVITTIKRYEYVPSSLTDPRKEQD